MPIDAVQPATASSASSVSNASDMGKAEFLRLLTTQLKCQDPLSPMENKDFVAQLAQFSSLEQLLNVNSNLQANFLVMQSLNNSSVASFIGKSVKADGNSVYLKDEGDAVLNYKLDSSAKVTVKIYDESGNIVRTISDDSWQDSGDRELAWDGCDSSGNRLSAGKYTFEVSATDANGDSVGVTTYVKGKITGVKFDNGVAVLLMDGLEVRLSDILEISE